MRFIIDGDVYLTLDDAKEVMRKAMLDVPFVHDTMVEGFEKLADFYISHYKKTKLVTDPDSDKMVGMELINGKYVHVSYLNEKPWEAAVVDDVRYYLAPIAFEEYKTALSMLDNCYTSMTKRWDTILYQCNGDKPCQYKYDEYIAACEEYNAYPIITPVMGKFMDMILDKRADIAPAVFIDSDDKSDIYAPQTFYAPVYRFDTWPEAISNVFQRLSDDKNLMDYLLVIGKEILSSYNGTDKFDEAVAAYEDLLNEHLTNMKNHDFG